MKSLTTFAALFLLGLLALHAEARPDPEANEPAASTTADQDHIIFGGGIFGQSGDGTADENQSPAASVGMADAANGWLNGPAAAIEGNGPATSEDKANAQNSVEATDCFGNGAGAPCAQNLWDTDGPATSEDKANAQNSAAAENIWFGPTTATENYPGPYDSEDKSTATYFNFGDVRSNAGPPCAETDKADCLTYAPKVTHMRPVYSRCGYFGITHGDCKALQCDWLPSPIGDCWAVKHEFPPT